MNTRLLSAIALFIFVFVLPSGYMIKNYLQNQYEEESKNSIIESFTELSSNLREGDKKSLRALVSLSKDIKLIASMNLIVNYENADSYEAKVFNAEKERLLNSLSLQSDLKRNDYIAIYDTANTLVSLLDNSKAKSTLFSAYEESNAIYYVKNSTTNSYEKQTVSLDVKSIIDELTLFSADYTNSSRVVYESIDKTLRVKSKVPILRTRVNNREETVGYIIAFKEYSQEYLSSLVTPNVSISYTKAPINTTKNPLKFSGSKYSMPELFNKRGFEQLLIQEEDSRFFARTRFPVKNGSLLIKIEAK